jgi:hypothetical protein
VGRITFSEGLRASGSTEIDFGDIAPGATVEFPVPTLAERAGPYRVDLAIEGWPGLSTVCRGEGTVVYPNLAISKTGPGGRYQRQPIEYQILVHSTGTSTAHRVELVDLLPPETRFLSSQPPGQIRGSSIHWDLGDLPAGENREIKVVLEGVVMGRARNCARVRAVSVPEIEACADTMILFAAAMHIDCEDLADPVEVGSHTTYLVTVQNEGEKATTDVAIAIDLPAECEFLAAHCDLSPGTYDSDAHRVVFEPIDSMAAAARVEFRVEVRCIRSGSAVCSAILRFAEFSKPVRSEEGTNIYE